MARAKSGLTTGISSAFNLVTDYPFRLKDRCRMDSLKIRVSEQFGTGLLSTETGFRELPDWDGLRENLPTIEDESIA